MHNPLYRNQPTKTDKILDFIFGTLATDPLKLYRHRLLRRGVVHQHRIQPQLPQLNKAITLSATTGPAAAVDALACYYTIDGSDPIGSRDTVSNGRIALFERGQTVWDTLIWGYVTHWHATIPALTKDVLLRYRIGAWSTEESATEQPEIFADYPHEKRSLELAAMRHFLSLAETPRTTSQTDEMGQNFSADSNEQALPDVGAQIVEPADGTIFALNVPARPVPKWAYDAIIYHIFVDRFYPGDGATWHENADDLMDIFGGTLQGVIDKLDYVAALGVNTIWLSPIFPSPSSHGYDATDFRSIEPRLGDEKILRTLVDGAHERGLRVVLDLACNHLSNEHPYFVDAFANPNSSYRGWFTFDDSEIGYRAFFGVKTLPEINLENPAAREWMIENARYWIREFEIDGYRLDHANGPGPDFWSYFNRACKELDPNCFCFGEIIDTPDMLQSFVGRLDGVLDFQINEALRKTFGWEEQNVDELAHFLAVHEHFYAYPEKFRTTFQKTEMGQNFSGERNLPEFVRLAFIDNHDMNRFCSIVAKNGTADERTALLAALNGLLKMPNPPVIYYGTEIGLSQSADVGEGLHANRVPMRWEDDRNFCLDNLSLLEEVKALIWARGK